MLKKCYHIFIMTPQENEKAENMSVVAGHLVVYLDIFLHQVDIVSQLML